VFAATPTHYVFSPSPIAAAGSLGVSHSVNVTVSAESSTNALVPGAVIYLSLSQTAGGGSAAVGATALTTALVPFTAATGSLTITYKTPAVLPTGGKDIIKAANAKVSPTITATDLYSFSLVTRYSFSPTAVATAGSLAANASVPVTVTSFNAANAALAGATVYLSFKPATGGGSAKVGVTALTATPMLFKAGLTGQIVITYVAPAVLPATGTDLLTAQDATKNATVSKADAYSFGKLASFALSPLPIAATGSLGAGKSVTVTLVSKDALGNPVAGAVVYLKFVPAAGGGTAIVGTKALTGTAAKFMTGTSGTIAIVYKTGVTVPLTGTDALSAGNLATGATLTATDSYTF
jgi:hypothetical protein